MYSIDLVDKANDTLKSRFPKKTHVAITMDDIEKVYSRNVLSIQADAKTKKGTSKGYLTGIMYLSPASLSGVNICPKSSNGCRASCLYTAGRGRFYAIERARLVKTLAYHLDTKRFIETIRASIKSLAIKAKNKGLIPVVRLNGTSDILFERNSDLIHSFPNIQFYDYTKISKRFLFNIPANYHLTLSLSESNDADARLALSKGISVAAVFRTSNLPSTFLGATVVNGDSTDLRFLDPRGVVVGLKAKGRAKTDKSGFVRDIQSESVAA